MFILRSFQRIASLPSETFQDLRRAICKCLVLNTTSSFWMQMATTNKIQSECYKIGKCVFNSKNCSWREISFVEFAINWWFRYYTFVNPSSKRRGLGTRVMQGKVPRSLSFYTSLFLASLFFKASIGPLHDPAKWYGINYAGTQLRYTATVGQNKGTRTSPARLSFVLEVLLCYLRSSITVYSVSRGRIVQRTYRPCPSYPMPLFQNESLCKTFLVSLICTKMNL